MLFFSGITLNGFSKCVILLDTEIMRVLSNGTIHMYSVNAKVCHTILIIPRGKQKHRFLAQILTKVS